MGAHRGLKLTIAAGWALTLAGLIGAALAGFGAQWGWWHFGTGFSVLRFSVYAALLGFALSLFGIFLARRKQQMRMQIPAAIAMVIALMVFGVPWSFLQNARNAPPIHDITTDTKDPPAFDKLLPLRDGARNPAGYEGARIAEMQMRGYPDIFPADLPAPPPAAFERALEAAKGEGWTIVHADKDTGRIEATDTTFWFGFTDDIVIRVQAVGGGESRVDIRSKSRVGRSDIGANAARIRGFLKRLRSG